MAGDFLKWFWPLVTGGAVLGASVTAVPEIWGAVKGITYSLGHILGLGAMVHAANPKQGAEVEGIQLHFQEPFVREMEVSRSNLPAELFPPDSKMWVRRQQTPAGHWVPLTKEDFILYGDMIALGRHPPFDYRANQANLKIYEVRWPSRNKAPYLLPVDAEQVMEAAKDPVAKISSLLLELGEFNRDLLSWKRLPDLLQQWKLHFMNSPEFKADMPPDIGIDFFPDLPGERVVFTNYSERILAILKGLDSRQATRVKIEKVETPGRRRLPNLNERWTERDIFFALAQVFSESPQTALEKFLLIESFLDTPEGTRIAEWFNMSPKARQDILETKNPLENKVKRMSRISFRLALREGAKVDFKLKHYQVAFKDLDLAKSFLNDTVLPARRIVDWVENMSAMQRDRFVSAMQEFESILAGSRIFRNYDRRRLSNLVLDWVLAGNDEQIRKVQKEVVRLKDGRRLG